MQIFNFGSQNVSRLSIICEASRNNIKRYIVRGLQQLLRICANLLCDEHFKTPAAINIGHEILCRTRSIPIIMIPIKNNSSSNSPADSQATFHWEKLNDLNKMNACMLRHIPQQWWTACYLLLVACCYIKRYTANLPLLFA